MPAPLSRYIATATQPLPPLADLGHSPDALSALTDMVGGARIVAIGESFHHTHELLVLREHLVRHLIAQLGFNTLLLEVVTPGANPIDTFVRGGAGDAENALIAAGARMWRNQETASLMNWVRQHNLANPAAQVSINGMDVLAIGPLMRAVLAHVRSADSERIATLSRGFDVDGRADQTAYNQLDADDRAALHRMFDAALDAVADDAAHEAALVVLNALAMLKVGARGWTEGFALRDSAMANAASRLIDRAAPDAKVIILSHNIHVAALAPADAPLHPPMGAFLRERYGDAYFVLGTAFGRAHFDPPIYGVAAFDGGTNAVDQDIAALNYPTALLDLRGADQALPLRLQGVGVGLLPYTDYRSLSAFDALAYVDVLTNARQLVETELTMDASAVDATRT